MSNEKIGKILESGTKQEKIKALESNVNSNDPQIVNKIISKLDDDDIEVRGEAFSSLVLNENNITDPLIKNLNSESKNIRAYTALVLANRKNSSAISSITPLTKDQSGMVRACALGALGYLKAKQSSKEIHECFVDSNLEVKKCALKALIDIGDKLSNSEIKLLSEEKDIEIKKMLQKLRLN
ncbi:MAG TPA: HEAT repeat domain-containing protein [Nitrosopumilaceae archaeon]|nr:HEAT repeat domain-containing protein [Nitrosopumilaceae archaeon]